MIALAEFRPERRWFLEPAGFVSPDWWRPTSGGQGLASGVTGILCRIKNGCTAVLEGAEDFKLIAGSIKALREESDEETNKDGNRHLYRCQRQHDSGMVWYDMEMYNTHAGAH